MKSPSKNSPTSVCQRNNEAVKNTGGKGIRNRYSSRGQQVTTSSKEQCKRCSATGRKREKINQLKDEGEETEMNGEKWW